MLRVRDIQRAAFDRRGHPGVGLRDHRHAAADHAGDHLIELGGPDPAVAADDVGAGRDHPIGDFRRTEPAVAARVLVEHHHRDDRRLGAALARDVDRVLDLEDRRERLEHDRVDAGEHERVDLIGEREPRGPALGGRRDPELDAGRADRARDERFLIRGGARELDGGAVDRLRLFGEPVPRERDPVRTERVGLDDIRAGGHVIGVDPAHELGLRDVELVVAARVQHAALVEQRAHRAVEQQRAVRERLGERGGHARNTRPGSASAPSPRRTVRRASPRPTCARWPPSNHKISVRQCAASSSA